MAHMALAAPRLPTLNSILAEASSIAAGDHEINHTSVMHAHDKDEIILTAFCEKCKQFYYHRVTCNALMAEKDPGRMAALYIQTFMDFLASQPCVGKGVISAIAQWLTDKLAAGPLERLEVAAELWYEKEPWPDELVMRVARELGFTDGSTLRLPAEHPLAPVA